MPGIIQGSHQLSVANVIASLKFIPPLSSIINSHIAQSGNVSSLRRDTWLLQPLLKLRVPRSDQGEISRSLLQALGGHLSSL